MAHKNAGAVKALQMELKKIIEEPVEGFTVKLANESNLFEWDVAIFGPPGTLYEGGYFKAVMRFPIDYPYSPPSVKFLTRMWHPNVYENGDVCISILHPPTDDPHSGELLSERWNPTQNVRTILLSIISLLNEPNTFSPANVDASVMYRKWRESMDKEYETMIRKQVLQTASDADKDGVVVPRTLDEYCITAKPSTAGSSADPLDYYDDDYMDDADLDDCVYESDDGDEHMDDDDDDQHDSGNEEC